MGKEVNNDILKGVIPLNVFRPIVLGIACTMIFCTERQIGGGQVEKVFENEDIGLCGVIGTHVQMKGVSGHWNSCVTSGYVMTKNPVTNKYSEKKYDDVLSSDDVEVVSVDGLWMCIPHRVFKYIRWDERTFKGFHCYDADIYMQVQHHNKKVVGLKNIAIEHHAVANFNTDFYESEKIWAEKWNDYLPMVRGIDVIGMHRLYMKERVAHRSVLDSKAFKLGTFLLNPFYKLKKLIK